MDEERNENIIPEETEEKEEKNIAPDYVGMAVSSGVAPLEMRFSQINSCYRKLPIAYRSFTYINSVTMGVLGPEKYCFATDGTDRGIRLSRWNIIEAMNIIKKMEAAGRHVEFVTARCSSRLARVDDLYEWMKELMKEQNFTSPEKLCLEFPQSLLFEEEEKTRLSVLNMKLLKIKTLMSGCGAEDCPVTNLMNIPVDYVILDPSVTTLAGNRNKGDAVNALISYLRTMQIEVIGDGVYNDNQITVLTRADCFGYIPSSGYKGSVGHGPLRMTADEATSQREEAEF